MEKESKLTEEDRVTVSVVNTFCHPLHALSCYVTFDLCRRKSARLSVTLLRPTQRVELFGNIFAPSILRETWAVCTKILGKNQKGSK